MKILIISILIILPSMLYSQLNTDFMANRTKSCENSIIQFQDLSTSNNIITSWTWTVNGTFFSTQPNPAYYFSAAGNYEICLTITNKVT